MFTKTLIFTTLVALVAAQEADKKIDLGIQIHPNGNPNKCLDIAGANFKDGTEVRVFDCNKTPAQNWLIKPGEGKIRVAAHPQFCLDAGTDLTDNGGGVKIWTCFDGLPQQDWFYTDDLRIAVTDKGKCLDLTDGILGGKGQASPQTQIWQCTDGNTNQVWATNILKARANRYEH